MSGIAMIALIVGVFIYRRNMQKKGWPSSTKDRAKVGRIMSIGGWVFAFLPIIIVICASPFEANALSEGSGVGAVLWFTLYTIPIGLWISYRGRKFIRQSLSQGGDEALHLEEDRAAYSGLSIQIGKILTFGGLVVAVLPLVVALIKWPSDHSALDTSSTEIQLLLWSFPFGLLIAATGAGTVRKYIAADELKVPNERKDPRAKRNMVFLLAALLNLSSGILLLSARSFESPANTAEREIHLSSISNLSLLNVLGFFVVIAGLVMTVGALIIKRIPSPTQNFLYAPGTMALFFSLFIVAVTVVGIRTVAGLA